MNDARFPLEPLLAVVTRPRDDLHSWTAPQLDMSHAAVVLGVERTKLYAWRRRGLTVWNADRLACRAGRHPSDIWPDWLPSAS